MEDNDDIGTEEEYEQMLESAERESDEFGSPGVIMGWSWDDVDIDWIPARWVNPPQKVSA